MSKYELINEDSILLVIDLQEKLMKAMEKREQVYKNTNLLIAIAKQFNIPIIITEQYPKGLGTTVSEIQNNLDQYEYVEKNSFNACTQSLKQILEKHKQKTILVTGSETHICVFQTVRDLLEKGYQVQVVKDAVCSRTEDNYNNGLDLMKDMGAVISNAETMVFDLLKVSGTPEFKAISPLLK
ncbi:MAG: isochorismatase family protein [Bacillota bacterium]|nr:isochorismatase family protein [Bacillota bacterium]